MSNAPKMVTHFDDFTHGVLLVEQLECYYSTTTYLLLIVIEELKANHKYGFTFSACHVHTNLTTVGLETRAIEF